MHKFPSLLEYKSPTTLEMCDVITYLVEDADPNGPFGAKEVGQGPLLPVMPAVANAVYDAVGVRVDEVPDHARESPRRAPRQRPGQRPRASARAQSPKSRGPNRSKSSRPPKAATAKRCPAWPCIRERLIYEASKC